MGDKAGIWVWVISCESESQKRTPWAQNCDSIPAGFCLLTYTEFVLIFHHSSTRKFGKLLVIFQKMYGGKNG